MDKIRVYNPRKYDIGLVLQSGMERVIHPGSFTPMARDDIEYAAVFYSFANLAFSAGASVPGRKAVCRLS